MHKIHGIFCTPVYMTRRDTNLSPFEMEEIKYIVDKELYTLGEEYFSIDNYIFNTKLKKIKEFCEQHINIYVKEIINPKRKCEPYITQSWLSVAEPGKSFHRHNHCNSIMSGVFYITTVENDEIWFYDINGPIKLRISFTPKEQNKWNSDCFRLGVTNNNLILFPSWLDHSVEKNETATATRISLAFNVFAKGNFGAAEDLTELNIT